MMQQKSFKVFVEQIDFMLFLRQWRCFLGDTFHVVHMPFGFEVLTLVGGCGEDGGLAADGTFDLFLFILRLGFDLLFLVFLFFLFSLFLLLLDTIQQFQSTELFSFKSFVFFVNDDSNQHFYDDFVKLFTDLCDFSIFVRFDVVGSADFSHFDLFFLIVINLQFFQFCFQSLQNLFLKGYSDLHFTTGNFVSFLDEFDAVKGLFFCGLIQFDWEMYFLDGQFDVVRCESTFSSWMDTFLNNDLDDICEYVGLLGLSFLITYLQFSPFQNDFNDFFLGLVWEKLIKVCLFSNYSVRCVLEDLFNLQDL